MLLTIILNGAPIRFYMEYIITNIFKGKRLIFILKMPLYMSGRIGKMVASHPEGCRVDSRPKLHLFILCTRRSGVLPMRVGGVTSQLDIPSLTLLSVASCGRLQRGVPHWLLQLITVSS